MLFRGGAKVTTDCFLAGQETQQILGVWMKKNPTLYYLNKYFFNSSCVTKYMGNVSQSNKRRE